MKKKLQSVLLALAMSIFFAIPAFAETNGELTLLPETLNVESEAQSVNSQMMGFDLTVFDNASQAAFAESVKSGKRLFDMPGYLDDDKAADVEQRLKNITAKYGQDAAVVMVYGRPAGMDMEAYADQLYDKGGFGTDADRSGSLLVIDYLEGKYHIYAQGAAMRYFTDKAIREIGTTQNGGIEGYLNNWQDYEALCSYTKSVDQLYAQGIQQDQANYNPETGEYDPAYPQQKKPFIKLWQVVVSLLISLLAGYLPIRSIKKQYAMEAEKKAAQSLSIAYRMTAAFVYSQLVQDRMLDKRVTRRVIPRPMVTSGGKTPGSGPSFGGGTSTMHHSSGGGFHTSGGGSFKGR